MSGTHVKTTSHADKQENARKKINRIGTQMAEIIELAKILKELV